MGTDGPLRIRGAAAMEALAHPTRVRMMHLLRSGPATASQLSRRLGVAYGSARFHLRVLVRAGIARPAGEQRRRGGRELYFVVPARLWIDWEPDAAPELRAANQRAMLSELGRRLDAAAGDQRPEDSQRSIIASLELELSPAQVQRAMEVIERSLAEIEGLEDPAPSTTEPFAISLFFFRVPRATALGGR